MKELERDMSLCIFNLKHRVQPVYDDAGYFKEHKILGDQKASALVRISIQLEQEHPNLLGEKSRLWDNITVLEKLLKKYEAIASGEPHDGRYKKFRIPESCFKIASIV